MRRKLYLSLGLLLLFIALTLAMIQDPRWFLLIAIPLAGVAMFDFFQKKHTILRNFPLLGHVRYFLEFFRPEVQQYFIADNESERPYNREIRNIVYQRAQNTLDTLPFGTARDILKVGYVWGLHSLSPKKVNPIEQKMHVGGPLCTKPYHASRLNISAMSFGSLSANAIMALNLGAKLGGFAQNTGEGGLTPYHLQGGDVIYQVGTGYFSCRDASGHFDPIQFKKNATRDEVKMIELKLSQGAKPSHGGILPAVKLTPEIAEIRGVPLGQDVLSPAAHSAFSTPLGLLDFIQQLRDLSGGKPVGFKLCIGQKKEFFGICKAMLQSNIYPDFITVDGAEGGSGAAPLEFSNHIGEPLDDGLVFVHNALTGIGLREHIRIICSGKIATGFDLVHRIAMGADLCNAARSMMLSVGCIQAKQCNANTCPTGIATQNLRLQRGLVVEDKKYRAAQYHQNTIHSFLELVGAMGFSTPNELNLHVIMQRVAENDSRPLSEIYVTLNPGQLLTEDIPETYQKPWQESSAETF